MSNFSQISFDNCKINLKTPWAAGCCGPKFKIIFLLLLLFFIELQYDKKLLFIVKSILLYVI